MHKNRAPLQACPKAPLSLARHRRAEKRHLECDQPLRCPPAKRKGAPAPTLPRNGPIPTPRCRGDSIVRARPIGSILGSKPAWFEWKATESCLTERAC
jgi:hypothetical protein